MQIDSGPFGHVWGVSRNQQIWCRIGITWKNLKGRGWRRVPGGLKYVSIGQFGPWGVNRGDYIYFRYGMSRARPQGKDTIDRRTFKQLFYKKMEANFLLIPVGCDKNYDRLVCHYSKVQVVF